MRAKVYLKSFQLFSDRLRTCTKRQLQRAGQRCQFAAELGTGRGGNDGFYLTLAEATALGLATGTTTLDGAVGFSSSLPFSYSTTSAPSGQYYLYGVVAHELSEVMGRISLLAYGGATSIMDLFRYASPGVRATSTSQKLPIFRTTGRSPV